MKELLTKKFWQDVKKTFEDAQKETEPVIQPSPPKQVTEAPASPVKAVPTPPELDGPGG